MLTKFAALVILYNYDEQCLENMKTYSDGLDVIFVFDNSTKKDSELEIKLKAMDKIYYIDGHGNQGLSYAINIVAHKAIKMGFQWLITFDQDSFAYNNILEQMKEFIESSTDINQIGIISPTIKIGMMKFKEVENKISYNEWVIQSGALHNLAAYLDVKGYNEKLFIDQVDIEYCIRLTQKGYKIVKLNHAILMHNTQDDHIKLLRFKGKKVIINKFSPMRYYYFLRNNLYCAKKYKNINTHYYAQLRRNIKVLVWNTLPYETDIMPRLKAVIAAYIDYKTGKMGKTKRQF